MLNWKTLTRIIIIVLTIGLLLVLVYGLYQLFKRYWYPILLGGYCLIGLFVLVDCLVGNFRTLTLDTPYGRDVFLARVPQQFVQTTGLEKLRKNVGIVLAILSSSIVWPTSVAFSINHYRKFFSNRKRLSLQSSSAYESLYPKEFTEALVWLGIVLALYAAHFLFSLHETFGRILLIIVTLYCTLKCLYYVVNPTSLVAQLRRGPGNAYVTFLVIAVALYCILILSFADLIYGVTNIHLAQLWEITLDMLKFKKAFSLYRGEPISPIDYYLTVAGFLYYISIFSAILRFKDFTRTDDDCLAIAQSYLILEKSREARNWIEKIKTPTASTYHLRAFILFAQNEQQRALNNMRKSLSILRDEPVSDGEVWYILVSGSLSYPIPEESVLAALKLWPSLKMHAAFLAEALDALLGRECLSPDSYTELIREISPNGEYPSLESQYDFYMGNSSPDEACERLRSMPPGEGLDNLLRLILILRIRIVNPNTTLEEDAASLEAWLAENLKDAAALARGLTDEQETLLAALQLSLVRMWAKRLGSARVQEIQSNVEEITQSIKTPDLLHKFNVLSTETEKAVPPWATVKRLLQSL